MADGGFGAGQIVGIVQAVKGTVRGVKNYHQAVKGIRANIRPIYEIDPIYQQNIDLIKANMGLPAEALNLFYNRAGQGTAAGINAVNASGGNPNNIATILNNQSRQFQDVLVQDALARKADLNALMQANLNLAEQHDKDFQINKYAPFADKATALAQQKLAAEQEWGGQQINVQGIVGASENAFGNRETQPRTVQPMQPASGVNYAAISRSVPQNGFSYYQQPANQMNLGANNSNYGLMTNYSLYAPLFGNNTTTYNPYAFGVN